MNNNSEYLGLFFKITTGFAIVAISFGILINNIQQEPNDSNIEGIEIVRAPVSYPESEK